MPNFSRVTSAYRRGVCAQRQRLDLSPPLGLRRAARTRSSHDLPDDRRSSVGQTLFGGWTQPDSSAVSAGMPFVSDSPLTHPRTQVLRLPVDAGAHSDRPRTQVHPAVLVDRSKDRAGAGFRDATTGIGPPLDSGRRCCKARAPQHPRNDRFPRRDPGRSASTLSDQGVASHADEPTTVLACRAISMLSAITTTPKGSPGGHRPRRGGDHTGERTGPPSDFGPSRCLAGPSGACSTAERNARLSRRSTRLASRGGRRG